MINVNQITAKLAQLPDQALQQYAQMHKTDPYLMALAVSESSRRKAIRQGQQTQMAGQEQPKVVDQELMAMAPQAAQPMPEETGIAQLPVEEADYAGGGIVAFADGGYSQLGPAGQYMVDLIKGRTQPIGSDAAARETLMKRRQAELQEQATGAPQATYSNEGRAYPTPVVSPEVAAPASTYPDLKGSVADSQRAAAAMTGSTGDTGATGATGARVGTPSTTGARASGLPDAMTLKGIEAAYKQPDMSDYESKAIAAAKASIDTEKGLLDLYKKQQAELGEFGVEREQRLKEREGVLKEDTAKNKGLAIFQAGLAMLAGESPNAFANIGKGAMVGLESYKTGLEKLNNRQEKLFDAYDTLADARREDKKLTQKEERELTGNIRRAEDNVKNTAANIAGKKFDVDSNRANKIGDAAVAASRTVYQEQQATARANKPSDTMQLLSLLGDGDVKKGFQVKTALEAGKFSLNEAYSKYLSAFAGKETLTPPMSMQEFAAQFNMLRATELPAGAKVTKLPGSK